MKKYVFSSILLLLVLLLSACTPHAETASTAGEETDPSYPMPSETVSGEADEGDTDAPSVRTDAPDTEGKDPASDATGAACHVWDAWVTVKEPTCELPGERVRTCSLCGKMETERLRHLTHDYTEWTVTLAPTCTERGREERSCLRCKEGKSRSVNATGHLFGEWITTEHVGCRTAGERFRACSFCRAEEKETLLPLGHAWGTDNVCSTCKARAVATEGLQFSQRADGTYAVRLYTGSSPTVIIPPYFEGRAVSEICDGAFAGKWVLGITVPEHVTRIADGAFEGCRVAEIVNDSALALRAGSGKHGGIAKYALLVHNGESRIHEENGWYLFDGGERASLIGYTGGERNPVLPETVDGIPYDRIHAYAFDGCARLSSVTLPAHLREIGDGAFRGCTSLSTVTIPDGVRVIGDGAFVGCTGLVSVTLGTGVERIGADAFLGCYKLSEVINRSSLPILAGEAGHGFVAVNALTVHTGESRITREGDFLILRNETANYLLSYLGTDAVAVLPVAIGGEQYQIRAYAFYESTTLKRVILGGGVNAIGVSAFGSRTSPKEIFFEGDASLWSRVMIYGELDATVYLYHSEPPEGGGHYWRYVDGAPMPW